MLEAAIYYLLKKHFRQEKHYVDLLEIFHEVRRRVTRHVRDECAMLTLYSM
jgi:farnesyl diphosphate synthase